MKRRFIITGVGHSGTGWAYKAMNYLGFACGHEWIYNFRDVHRWGNLQGDSAWPAAALLDKMPPNTHVAHLVRDPIEVVTSAHLAGFTNLRICNTPYMKYVTRHLPYMQEISDDYERAMAWVFAWNRLAERKAEGIPFRRFRIEDISTDPHQLRLFCAHLTGVLPEQKVVKDVMSIIPTNYNSHRKGKDPITWGDLPDSSPWRQRLAEMAVEYGYQSY